MTTRKRPQQELACYFSELLTELEDIADDAENAAVQHSVAQPLLQQAVQQRVKKVASDATDNNKSASTPNDVSDSKRVFADVSPSASSATTDQQRRSNHVASTNEVRHAPPHTTSDKIAYTVEQVPNPRSRENIQDKIESQNQESTLAQALSDRASTMVANKLLNTVPDTLPDNAHNSAHNSAHKIVQQKVPETSPQVFLPPKKDSNVDADFDLRQREKERLERLLNSFSPVADLPAVELPKVVAREEIESKKKKSPIDTMVVKVNNPSTLSHSVDTRLLDAHPLKAITRPIASSIPLVEMKEASHVTSSIDTNTDQQWQPLDHQWLPNGRPAWAENPFDVLLVDIQGVQLAMPLAALDGIYPLEEELTPLFGQSTWFMGLQKMMAGNINVVNTAQFIMPERYKETDEMTSMYTVAINGSGWALAVDGIRQPIKVNPDEIRWRARRAERPWMAGTIINHVCALIDIPSLAKMLKQYDRNQP
jgi:hypothetical protein